MKKSIIAMTIITTLAAASFTGCAKRDAKPEGSKPQASNTAIEITSSAEQEASSQTQESTVESAVDSISESTAESVGESISESTSDSEESSALSGQQAYDYVINYMKAKGILPAPLEDGTEDYPSYVILDEEKESDTEYVITYRAMTAAFTYFYVDKKTGDVRMTACIPGIVDDETPTGETFNVFDYK